MNVNKKINWLKIKDYLRCQFVNGENWKEIILFKCTEKYIQEYDM